MKKNIKVIITFFVIISFVSIVYILGSIKKSPEPVITPTPISNTHIDLRSIQIEQADTTRVNELLGNPKKSVVVGDKLVSEYKTTNEFRNHIIEFENSKVALVKEMVNEITSNYADRLRSEFGVAPEILYSTDPSAVFDLYIYPSDGVAYLGSEDGVVLEIWYFQPTDINTFKTKFGSGYSTTKSTIKRH